METYSGILRIRTSNRGSHAEGRYAFLHPEEGDPVKVCRTDAPPFDDPGLVPFDGRQVEITGAMRHGWLVAETIVRIGEESVPAPTAAEQGDGPAGAACGDAPAPDLCPEAGGEHPGAAAQPDGLRTGEGPAATGPADGRAAGAEPAGEIPVGEIPVAEKAARNAAHDENDNMQTP